VIRAWAFRNPGPRELLMAAGAAPLPAPVSRRMTAVVVGLALGLVASLALPEVSGSYAGAAIAGAALLLGGWWAMARWAEPRTTPEGVLVLGEEELAGKLCTELLAGRHVRHYAGAAAPGAESRNGAGMTVDPHELRELVQRERITRIVVVQLDERTREQIAGALLECRLLGVEVEDAVELYQRLHGKLWLEAIDPGRLAFSDGFRITPTYRLVKRLNDVVCAVVLLAAASPLMALVALAIKLESRGPVLFRQERVGQFGKPFTLLKFRSMRQDAELATGPTWARRNDDRVTRIGRLLRRFHVDEIPQAINVLRGDLSFVGPRPERPCFVEMLSASIHYYHLRHYVQPGITGWAQISYPYADSIEDSYEKLQYDLYYARTASLGFDLRILFRTAVVTFTGRGR
jgi:exopolysaccharide biosynthesis polyprenyl glycosylphosphotransferase